MNLLAAIIVIGAYLIGLVSAEDTLVEGGRSPDGLSEVRLVRAEGYDPNKDGSEYSFQVTSTTTGKALLTIDGSGFRSYSNATSYCEALWSPSNSLVAITDRWTKHTNKMYVVQVTRDAATAIEIPDYIDSAVKRVGAARFDFACISTPKEWTNDRLTLQLYFTANGRQSYLSVVALRIVPHDNFAATLVIDAVTAPQQDHAEQGGPQQNLTGVRDR
jgi:hypothetical protein